MISFDRQTIRDSWLKGTVEYPSSIQFSSPPLEEDTAGPAKRMAEEAQNRIQKAIGNFVDEIDKSRLRRLQVT